jgi:8-oxo-dGTP pyrophosphatase MutT (NUDIX family)
MITDINQAIKQAQTYDKIKSTILVADKNSDIIILQRASHDENPGTWELPGGGIDNKGGLTQTYLSQEAKREVFEEAGVSLDSIIFAYMLDFTNPKGQVQGNYMFIAKIDTELNPETSHEHDNHSVVSLEQAIKQLSFENHRNLVKFYLKSKLNNINS